MKKTALIVLLLNILVSKYFSPVFCDDKNKKYLVLVADFGKDGPSNEILDILSEEAKLEISIVWPKGLMPSEQLKSLVQDGQIEPALTLEPEPILPLIYETKISSPISVDFSWPEDVWNIIAKNQEDFYENLSVKSSGLYLRSGIFSRKLIKGFKKLGLLWTNKNDAPGEKSSCYLIDKFLILSKGENNFLNVRELERYVDSTSEPVIVVFFDKNYPLKAEFLQNIADIFSDDAAVEVITPARLLKESRNVIAQAMDFTEQGTSLWQRRPGIWHKLSAARNMVEEYKNSGQAKPKLLDTLKDELYQLYSYDLIGRLSENPQEEDEQLFQAGLNNVYKLLDRQPSPEIAKGFDVLSDYSSNSSSFSVKSTVNGLNFSNSSSSNGQIRIDKFDVSLSSENVTYIVQLATVPVIPLRIDIYMDLNNKRGAGLTRLLPVTEAFVEPKNAWEFAICMEKNQISLYRSGRFEPALLGKFKSSKSYIVQIPRTTLRGNPLKWSYQVVTLCQNGTIWNVDDFLCENDELRQRLLSQQPIQLPAVKAEQSNDNYE